MRRRRKAHQPNKMPLHMQLMVRWSIQHPARHAPLADTFFTPAPVPATPGSATPSEAPKQDALLRELADLKNQLAQRDAHISTLQQQLAARDAELASLKQQQNGTGAPEASVAPDEIARLQERLGALKAEQAQADAARAAAWAELRSCVADISKLANVNHTPVALDV